MSLTQSRSETNDSLFGKPGSGRSSNTSGWQHRPFNGRGRGRGRGRGGITPTSHLDPPLSNNLSYKKVNNAQGGQSMANPETVNKSDSNPASGARSVNNDHLQPALQGVSKTPAPAAVAKPADAPPQKTGRPLSRAPSSSTNSDTTLPSTPAKGDGAKGFTLQFGSLSPGFMNDLQVPARTSSALLNLDEKTHDQARHDASRAVSEVPLPISLKQDLSKKAVVLIEKPITQEIKTEPHAKKNVLMVSTSPPTQAHQPSALPMAGISMPLPFQQPRASMKFCGPNPQIESQGIPTSSLQMPSHMPLVENSSQIPQQVFVPGRSHPPIQTSQIMHRGQNMVYYQLPNHLPHHLWNYGINTGYYLNSYTTGPPILPAPSSHPLTSTELNATTQESRLHYPVSQGQSNISVVNLPSNTLSVKSGVSKHGNADTSSADHIRNVQNIVPQAQPSSIPVTIKAAGEKATSTDGIGKVQPPKLLNPDSGFLKRDVEVSLQLKSGGGQLDQLAPIPAHVSAATPIPATSLAVVKATPRELASVPSHVDAISKVTDVTPISIGDAQKQPSKKVDGQSNFEVLKGLDGFSETATSESSQTKMILTSSGLTDATPRDSSATKIFAKSSHASESRKSPTNESAKQYCPPPCEDITRESSMRKDGGEQEHPKVLLSDNALKGSDALKGTDQDHHVKLTKKAGVTPKPVSANILEASTEHELKVMDISSISGSSKVSMESNKTKNRGRKKWKKLLKKADALGTTTDLYVAYKGPEDKEESFVAPEHALEGNMNEVSTNANVIEDNTLKNKDKQSNVEIDDWEDAADISTPNLDFSGEGVHSEVHVTEKKYSRDFLLTFSEHCTDIPKGFEITSDIAGALLCGSVSTLRSDREYPVPRRAVDIPDVVSRLDRRGSGTIDAVRWNKQPGPFPPSQDSRMDTAYGNNVLGSQGGRGPTFGFLRNPRAQHGEGILSGPMPQSLQRNNSDPWQRATNFHKVFVPSTHAPAPVIHKAEIKYEVGKVTDEEQAKQRKLKGILNKLTPQNFDRLFEQVKEVNIDNVITLTGVISQIFDKALTEPTFCEMYANFCQHLACKLPDLSVDNEKITFRRLLLNKCQEEFERGEREEQEACNVDGEGSTEQSVELREEKRVTARRRMLGNIRLIGELYKKGMLTERIMHECIKKLLGQYQNPDEENIEALCKLMSTIGEMIDHPKGKEHMDAYFDIMRQLSNNMVLSSRVRFMLKDAIDLRKNKWQQRMKVEGPKKIEDVHRDAAQERQEQLSRSNRGPGFNSAIRRGQDLEYGPRGSMLPSSVGQGMGFRGIPPQVRGFGRQDIRMDERNISLPQRLSDEQITLGPQGGLAKGMAFRGQPPVSNPPIFDNPPSFGDHRRVAGGFNDYGTARVYSTRENYFNRNATNRVGASAAYDQLTGQELHPIHTDKELRFPNCKFESSMPTTPPLPRSGGSVTQNNSTERPEELLRDMSLAAIKEYYSAKDEKEVALCIKDLKSPSFCSTVVSLWVNDSFERKDIDRDLLAKLLVALTKPRDGTFSPSQLIKGFESVLTDLEDTVTDAPKAPEFLGRIFAKLVLENVLSLEDVGRLIQHCGEEAGRLVEVGLAAEVLGSLLEMIKSEKGESSFREIRSSCNLQLEDFRPPHPIRCRKLEMLM